MATPELHFAIEKKAFKYRLQTDISKRLSERRNDDIEYRGRCNAFERHFPPGSITIQEIFDGSVVIPEEARIEVVDALLTRADRGQMETLTGWTRGLCRPSFTLAEANQIFKYTEEHPEREDLEFFRELKRWFDDILEASEGQMVWTTKPERQKRLNLQTITGDYLEIPPKVVELTRACGSWAHKMGLGRREFPAAIAWFSPSKTGGCPIKPAKPYSFFSHIPLSGFRVNGGIRGRETREG
jgi:hypothetical protein